ncbi:(2R,3R)-2,3-butanediol dehydrogenase [Dionaea muscipula]
MEEENRTGPWCAGITNSKRLEGKVAIITGGASGIGASTVNLFHQHGAKVVIADIQDDLGRDLATKLGGENVIFIHCDVSDEEQVSNLIDITVTTFKGLDVMYNNAGILDNNVNGSSILTAKKSDLERVIGVNLVGGFLGAKHAARVMVPRKQGGCILFTASAAASIAGMGATHAYAASKHAIVGLAKNLAAELGIHGIRVNCVSPYGVRTNISRGLGHDFTPQAEATITEAANLKGVILQVEDVAKAALYLASDEASYVSGVNLLVDGGYSIVNPSLINTYKSFMQ